MKRSLLILSLVLLIASLFGVIKAFTLPTETKTEAPVTLLDYQHEGKFDYLVYLKPSYLFGSEPQEPPLPSNLKYPTEMIDRFNLTFTYRLVPDKPAARISAEVEVRAIVKSPGAAQKEIILVPKSDAVISGTCCRTSPVLVLSASKACITPGRAVDICTVEFWVMMLAMTLPPNAGLVCMRTPINSCLPLLKSAISSPVQSAVNPELAR